MAIVHTTCGHTADFEWAKSHVVWIKDEDRAGQRDVWYGTLCPLCWDSNEKARTILYTTEQKEKYLKKGRKAKTFRLVGG